MQKYKLARVRWQLGQTLLPEHFAIEEDSLEAEIRLAGELAGLPYRGVAALAWNEALLTEGSLAVSALTAVLPGGYLVDVPGNATIPPFSLESTGKSKLALHLHLLADPEPRGTEGVPLYADDPKTVQRVLFRLQLSTEPALDRTLSELKLADLEKSLDGVWRLSPAYVPPLLLVGASPFLGETLDRLSQLLDRSKNQLRAEVTDSMLRSDRLTNARRCFFEVQRLQAILEDMKHQVYPHPYSLFDSLRRFYFEVCCYLEALPEEIPVYEHEDLGTGFAGFMKLLDQALAPKHTRSTHQLFVVRDGQFVLSPLPADLAAGGSDMEAYLLVQRNEPGKPTPMDGVKLASPSRLPIVRRLALTGIPLKYVPSPKFPHAFGPDLDFYLLAQGEEWQYALREDAIAFYVTPALADTQVSLFWRKG